MEENITSETAGQLYNYAVDDTLNGTYSVPSFWPVSLHFRRIIQQQDHYEKEEIKIIRQDA